MLCAMTLCVLEFEVGSSYSGSVLLGYDVVGDEVMVWPACVVTVAWLRVACAVVWWVIGWTGVAEPGQDIAFDTRRWFYPGIHSILDVFGILSAPKPNAALSIHNEH